MSMTCPKCGDPYPCVHERPPAPRVSERTKPSATAAGGRADVEREHWREEVITRVRQHRARRRRFAPNASLELDFQSEPPLTIAPGPAEAIPQPVYPAEETTALSERLDRRSAAPRRRKIIYFPGPTEVESKAESEEQYQAEPQQPFAEPRILEASEVADGYTNERAIQPEQIPLIPSFADIRLDDAPAENAFREELNLPAEPAPLARRLSSGLVDGAIVLVALIVFAACFAAALASFAGSLPHYSRQALPFILAAGAMLALLFQYLFLVYGKRTPGMGAASLELLTFDGGEPSRAARRSRALAATLSGVSLGLGFAWAVVDEDALGWHDRISGTYVKSSN